MEEALKKIRDMPRPQAGIYEEVFKKMVSDMKEIAENALQDEGK